MTKILFICNANVNRSKTAEVLFKEQYETKSGGIYCEDTATTNKVSQEMLEWADIIMVFEEEHIQFLKNNYPETYTYKTIINIELPDIYTYMSEYLQERLQWKISNAMKYKNQKTGNIILYHELNIPDDKYSETYDNNKTNWNARAQRRDRNRKMRT